MTAEIARRAVDLSVHRRDAQEDGINTPQVCEADVARAAAQRGEAQWLEENRSALDSSNAYVENNDLLLAQFRTFKGLVRRLPNWRGRELLARRAGPVVVPLLPCAGEAAGSIPSLKSKDVAG